ncbi:hypothetical protein [Streptomyces alfalfae]
MTEFPVVVEDEHGEPAVEDHPEPLLGQNGEASDVGGVLASVLLRGQDTRPGAWALTSRQEIHPDRSEETGSLLGWLAARAGDARRPVDLGWIRFHASREVEPLVVCDGEVVRPAWRPSSDRGAVRMRGSAVVTVVRG